MSPCVIALCVIASSAFAAPAAAQTPRAKVTKPSVGLFGVFDYSTIAAKNSYDAVFGKHDTMGPGVGVEVANLWKGAFVRVAGSRSSLDGERVVIFNDEVFELGIPVTAELTPIEFGGGWRFSPRHPSSRITPYAGASAITLKYKETSPLGDAADNVDETFTGFGLFAGADVRLARQVFAGVEGQYRSIPFTPGDFSAAASFNETDLGGFVLRVRLGIRF